MEFFQSYFDLLSQNLVTFLKGNFKNLLMSYYSSSFEYCSQINDHSVINEMNVSLNITYDFELDNLNWFMTGSERNAETEQNIVNILMSLLELSDYDI